VVELDVVVDDVDVEVVVDVETVVVVEVVIGWVYSIVNTGLYDSVACSFEKHPPCLLL